MKAAFGVQAHGWTPHAATCAPKPWVAEIYGIDSTYGYCRRFVPHKTDHPAARGHRDSGVWFWWTLTSGCYYQARYLTTRRGNWTTRWITVTPTGEVRDIVEEEVRQWANACSESTS